MRRVSLCLLAAACVESVDTQPTPAESASTLAVFAPDSAQPCNSVVPFPNDLARDTATGLVKVPYCPEDDATTIAMKTGLRTLDGFSVKTPIYFPVSGDISESSAATGVVLINTRTSAPVTFLPVYQADDKRVVLVTSTLEENTTYLVVVTTDVKNGRNESIGSDQIFTFAKSTVPLIDADGYSQFPSLSDAEANALETLRRGLAPMFTQIETGLGIPRAKIAIAWTFKTQNVTARRSLLGGAIAALPRATVEHYTTIAAADHPLLAAAGIPSDNLCDIHTGRINLHNFVTAGGTLDPAGPTRATVDYMLVTPEVSNNCPSDWAPTKVLIFAHALGRCKNDALALADTVAAAPAGYAVLTLDGPRAGSRTSVNRGDADLDGCADQPETPELIGLDGPNPFGVRDLLAQWALELGQAARVARAVPWELAGQADPGGTPTPPEVSMFGHSWGGIAVSLAATFADVDAVAVNAASASFGDIFMPSIQASIAQELIANGLNPAVEPGLSMLADELQQAVVTFTWVLEQSDPLYAEPAWPGDLPMLVQVVASGGVDAPLHHNTTQRSLASLVHSGATLTAVTHTLTWDDPSTTETTLVPICDDGTAAVGAILQPCASEGTDRVNASLGKLAAMRTQLVTFLLTHNVQ